VCFGSFASLLTYLSMSAIRPISDLQFDVANTETGVIQAPEPGPRIMRYELTDFEWAAIRPSFRTSRAASRGSTTDVSLTASSGYCGQAHHGATCRRGLGLTRPATTGSFVGEWLASGT